MPLSRPPKDLLRPFVRQLWVSDGGGARSGGSGREMMLPSVSPHLVLRLAENPLRIFWNRDDAEGFTVSAAVIGGPRSAPYVKDTSQPVATVGAVLTPGAAGLLLGAPAKQFSGRHTALEDVWGVAPVAELRQRLWAARSASCRLDLFEAALVARLPRLRGIDPMIARALAGFEAGASVGAVVGRSDYSHRHFARRFTESVGLKPKTYCRLLRFGRVLDRLAAGPSETAADLAAEAGYADQAHLTREFRRFADLSPGRYRRMAPRFARHVAL